jgi:hypothetical protein
MEFSIWCPRDGQIDVGVEDIDSVIVRGGSDVEVVFACPVCGRKISMAAQVPHALMASLDEGWVRVDGADRLVSLRREGASPGGPIPPEDGEPDDRIESYCEYFRRELAIAGTVDDVLSEIDAHEVR